MADLRRIVDSGLLRRMLNEGSLSPKHAALLGDFAASGDSCRENVRVSFRNASCKRDINERRKAVAVVLSQAIESQAIL